MGSSVQEAVLELVVNEPRYGYWIARELQSDHARTAVYETLRRLLELRLIELVNMPEARRPRKWYRATALGQALHDRLVASALRKRHDLVERLQDRPLESVLAVLDEIESRALQQLAEDQCEGTNLVDRVLARRRRLVSEVDITWARESREMIRDGLSTA